MEGICWVDLQHTPHVMSKLYICLRLLGGIFSGSEWHTKAEWLDRVYYVGLQLISLSTAQLPSCSGVTGWGPTMYRMTCQCCTPLGGVYCTGLQLAPRSPLHLPSNLELVVRVQQGPKPCSKVLGSLGMLGGYWPGSQLRTKAARQGGVFCVGHHLVPQSTGCSPVTWIHCAGPYATRDM